MFYRHNATVVHKVVIRHSTPLHCGDLAAVFLLLGLIALCLGPDGRLTAAGGTKYDLLVFGIPLTAVATEAPAKLEVSGRRPPS